MKYSIVCLLLVTSAVLSSCNISGIIDGVRGNGTVVDQPRTTGAFNRVVIEGSIDVIAHVSNDPQTVIVHADENLLSLIRTEVRDSTLHIYSDKGYSSSKRIYVSVNVNALRGVAIEGSADLTADGLNSVPFELHIDGSGDARLSGSVSSFYAEINGSGDISAENLHANNVELSINGSGDADVYASQKLIVRINGSGDVRYSGNPAMVEPHIDGSGDLIKK